MPYSVVFLDHAIKDLKVIQGYLDSKAPDAIALKTIQHLEKICYSFSEHPERGSVPRELVPTGISDYRQLIASPYRIIYQVVDNTVFVYGLIHGRRNVQAVLRQRRLISNR